MASFLEKWGLVEKDEIEVQASDVGSPIPTAESRVDVEINSAENIIDEIYKQYHIEDRSNSIYTIQALIDTLPSEMTKAKMQTTVSGILSVSGKSLDALIADGQDRGSILITACGHVEDEHKHIIDVANSDIEKLKAAIEVASVKIKESEEIIAATRKAIEDETAIIETLLKFAEGMKGDNA